MFLIPGVHDTVIPGRCLTHRTRQNFGTCLITCSYLKKPVDLVGHFEDLEGIEGEANVRQDHTLSVHLTRNYFSADWRGHGQKETGGG